MFFKKENKKERITILNFSDYAIIDNKIKKNIKEKIGDYDLIIYKRHPEKEFEINDIIKKSNLIIIIANKEDIEEYEIKIINENFNIIKQGKIKNINFKNQIIKKIIEQFMSTSIITLLIDKYNFTFYEAYKEKIKFNLLKTIEKINEYLKKNNLNELLFKNFDMHYHFDVKKINFYLSNKIFYNNKEIANNVKSKIDVLEFNFKNKNVIFKTFDLDKIFNGDLNEIENDDKTINIIIFTKDYDKYNNLFIIEKELAMPGNVEIVKKFMLNYDYYNLKEPKIMLENFINFFSKFKNIIIINATKSAINNSNYIFYTSDIEAIYNNISIYKKHLTNNIKNILIEFNLNEFCNYLKEKIEKDVVNNELFKKTIESYINVLKLN